MRGTTAKSIKDRGKGFIIGKINQRKGSLFCVEERRSFRIQTYPSHETEGIESSILINPIVKIQLMRLGYKAISKRSSWDSIGDRYEYDEVIQLKEFVFLSSQGKKYKMI